MPIRKRIIIMRIACVFLVEFVCVYARIILVVRILVEIIIVCERIVEIVIVVHKLVEFVWVLGYCITDLD